MYVLEWAQNEFLSVMFRCEEINMLTIHHREQRAQWSVIWRQDVSFRKLKMKEATLTPRVHYTVFK